MAYAGIYEALCKAWRAPGKHYEDTERDTAQRYTDGV
jgi:hypothetical protein